MTASTDALAALHTEISDRLLRMYPEEIRACLAKLDDEQIWWRPNAAANSVGNLVLHLSGNLNHYLGHGVAGSSYKRDRPTEFSETGPVSREILLARFEESLVWARKAVERATPDRWMEIADLGPESMPIANLLIAVTTHFNGHVGQIIYVTKMIREGVFVDLWKQVRDR